MASLAEASVVEVVVAIMVVDVIVLVTVTNRVVLLSTLHSFSLEHGDFLLRHNLEMMLQKNKWKFG